MSFEIKCFPVKGMKIQEKSVRKRENDIKGESMETKDN